MLEIFTTFLVSGCVLFTDLVTERERHLTTGKRAERTKLEFRCPICRSAIGQAICLIYARSRQLLLNQLFTFVPQDGVKSVRCCKTGPKVL